MNFLLLQYPHEIKNAIKHFHLKFNELKLIAWSPSCVSKLEELGLDYICPGDLYIDDFDWEDLRKLYKDYGQWCSDIDMIIANAIPQFSKFNIKPFLHQFLHSRVHYFRYFTEIDSISNLVNQYSPDNIYYYHYQDKYNSPISRLIKNGGNISIKQLFKPLPFYNSKQLNNDISFQNFISLYDIKQNTYKKTIFRYTRDTFKSLITFSRPVFNFLSMISSISFGLFARRKKNILVFDSSEYETNSLLRSLKISYPNLRLIYWPYIVNKNVEEIDIVSDIIIQEIRNRKHSMDFFFRKGFDLFNLFFPEIIRTVKKDLPIYYNNVIKFTELNKKLNFICIISSYESAILEAISQQCQILKLPVIINLHGNTVGYMNGSPPMYQYVRDDGNHFHHFVYTNPIKSFQNNNLKYYNKNVNQVVVGSSYFRKLFHIFKHKKYYNNDRIKICFVLGSIHPQHSVGSKKGLLDDSKSYELLLKTVQLLKNSKNIELTIKSGYNIENNTSLSLFKYIQNGYFSNINLIESSKPFNSIIGDHQLYIFTNISTSFFECICSKSNILLLAGSNCCSLGSKSKRLINKRVSLVYTENNFINKIKEIKIAGLNSSTFKENNIHDLDLFNSYCWDGKNDPAVYGAKWIIQNIINYNAGSI